MSPSNTAWKQPRSTTQACPHIRDLPGKCSTIKLVRETGRRAETPSGSVPRRNWKSAALCPRGRPNGNREGVSEPASPRGRAAAGDAGWPGQARERPGSPVSHGLCPHGDGVPSCHPARCSGPRDSPRSQGACSSVFRAALFTAAKSWCPSRRERTDMLRQGHAVESRGTHHRPAWPRGQTREAPRRAGGARLAVRSGDVLEVTLRDRKRVTGSRVDHKKEAGGRTVLHPDFGGGRMTLDIGHKSQRAAHEKSELRCM